MALKYGCVKCKIVSDPVLKPSHHGHETQYHLHATLEVKSADGSLQHWDTAINVGTNDADDLLRYRLAFDFHHTILQSLSDMPAGFQDLTQKHDFPALDFLRSDILAETGDWRDSDVMDGSEEVEPVATLKRLLTRAKNQGLDVYIFGRTYTGGGKGIHDVHMNQGSDKPFLNNGEDDHNDHNDVWQDGAVIVNVGQPEWAAYFTAFTQQRVPTDDLGNPRANSFEITEADDGSLAPH